MNEARQEFQRGLKALEAGKYGQALSGFLMALALDPDTQQYRRHALEALGTISGYTSLPQPVLDGLSRCVEDPDLDLQPLALVVSTLLAHTPLRERWISIIQSGDSAKIESALSDGLFDGLLTDTLTRAVLIHAISISLDLEDLLTGLRQHVLACSVNGYTSTLLSRYRDFYTALAQQAERTDFAWAVSDQEVKWLDEIEGQTDSQLIISAYRKTETEQILDFPRLTAISDPVSQTVLDQYTAYPYPRWERLPPPSSASLLSVMENRFPTENWPSRFTVSVTGLSAGCGTGRGALLLARTIENLSLTAVDLSSSSLNFAKKKSKELEVDNVTFGLGDILELGSLNQRFDIIESGGVLHHMHDPAAGLATLTNVLAPDGVMRLALYSERARAAVIAARQWLTDQGIGHSAADVRTARSLIRDLPQGHPAKPVQETPEYFVLSGLHDLIFNVQEHRFTPKQLKALLQGAGLRFLGFDHTDPAIANRYEKSFPTDVNQTDLDNWDMFEQNHPETFAEMFQFWCRPVDA